MKFYKYPNNPEYNFIIFEEEDLDKHGEIKRDLWTYFCGAFCAKFYLVPYLKIRTFFEKNGHWLMTLSNSCYSLKAYTKEIKDIIDKSIWEKQGFCTYKYIKLKPEITMTIDEQIAILQAYKEGKEIIGSYKFDTQGSWICNKEGYEFNFSEKTYKIKSQPTCRPYSSAEEFLQAQKEHGLYLRCMGVTTGYIYPIRVNNICIYFIDPYGKICKKEYEALLKEYWTWQDGTPCYIKVK